MNARPLFKLALAVAIVSALGACNLVGGKPHDGTWPVEVEAVAMTAHADAAAEGNVEAFDSLRASRDAVEAALGAASNPAAADIGTSWSESRRLADVILAQQPAVLEVNAAEAEFSAAVPQLMARIDEIGRWVAEGSDPRAVKQVFLLGRSQVLLQRLQWRAEQVREAGIDAVSAADAFGRDSTVLERTLAGLQDGDAELAIDAITVSEAQASLGEVRQLLAAARTQAEPLFTSLTGVIEAREAADEMPHAIAELRSVLQRDRVRR